jgi:hypothetical protein
LFLVKYNSSHGVDWVKAIASYSEDVKGYDVATTPCGQVWVSGSYNADAHIDGDTLHLPSGHGGDPSFIAGYDFSGAVTGYAGLISGGDDMNGVACDQSGNVFICGDYWTGSLTIGPDTLVATNPAYEYLFVGKYGYPSSVPSVIYAHHDTTYCGGEGIATRDSITISAPSGYHKYLWNDGETTQTRVLTTGGDFWVSSTTCGSTLIDTFHVVKLPDFSIINQDTVLCHFSDTNPIVLTAPPASGAYKWFNGDTTSVDTVYSAGTYWVTYYIACTLFTDSIHVVFSQHPSPISGNDSVCLGETATFQEGFGAAVLRLSVLLIRITASLTEQLRARPPLNIRYREAVLLRKILQSMPRHV